MDHFCYITSISENCSNKQANQPTKQNFFIQIFRTLQPKVCDFGIWLSKCSGRPWIMKPKYPKAHFTQNSAVFGSFGEIWRNFIPIWLNGGAMGTGSTDFYPNLYFFEKVVYSLKRLQKNFFVKSMLGAQTIQNPFIPGFENAFKTKFQSTNCDHKLWRVNMPTFGNRQSRLHCLIKKGAKIATNVARFVYCANSQLLASLGSEER